MARRNIVLPWPSHQSRGRGYAALDLPVSLRGPEFGAAGDGVTDDTNAILSAFASGERLTGRGHTYAVSGNLTMSDGLYLEDTTFKQLDPNDTSRRTLTKTSGSGLTLRRVTVDRNGATTDGSVADAAGIWIANIDDLYLEDVEVMGDGKGTGLLLSACDRPHLVRPYVHDIRWGASSDPGTEQLVGLWFVNCTDVRVDNPHIADLTGEITWAAGQTIAISNGIQWRIYGGNAYKAASTGTTGATPPTHTAGTVSDGGVSWLYIGASATNARAYQADGLDCGGCTNVDIRGGVFERVWEGCDISGTVGNRNVWLDGTRAKDCDSYGFKFAHKVYDSGFIGCHAIGCGKTGFALGGGNNAADAGDNILLDSCMALDIGSGGEWAGNVISGYHVFSNATNGAKNVVAQHCKAVDRQVAPTMTIGFRNEPADPANFRIINCYSNGPTVETNGFDTSGIVEQLTDGSQKVTGDLLVTGTVTSSLGGDIGVSGTFVPEFTAESTPPTGVTYSTQTGVYTKIGRVVYYTATVGLTSKGAGGVGNVNIINLPFTAIASSFYGSVVHSALNLDAGYTYTVPVVVASSTKIRLNEVGDNNSVANVAWSIAADTSLFVISGFYFAS